MSVIFFRFGPGRWGGIATPFRMTLAMCILFIVVFLWLDGFALEYQPWQAWTFTLGMLACSYVLFSNTYYDMFGD